MIIALYKNYGVLSSEKKVVYTPYAPASDIYDKIKVDVPMRFIAGFNSFGELLIDLKVCTVPLPDVIATNKNGDPIFRWYDGAYHTYVLKEIEFNANTVVYWPFGEYLADNGRDSAVFTSDGVLTEKEAKIIIDRWKESYDLRFAGYDVYKGSRKKKTVCVLTKDEKEVS